MSSPPNVYDAIKNVMRDIGLEGISKNRNNAQQGYKFRGIDDVYNALNSILSKHSLVMLPRVIDRSQVERQTKSGGNLFYTTVTVEFKLVSSLDGSSDTIITVGEAMDSADKSSNKAQAAAFKYAAMMVFCIPTEGDNDADGTTHEPTPRPAAMPSVAGTNGASKAGNRAMFEKLIKEVRDIARLSELTAWYTSNVAAIDAMPPDWIDDLRAEYSDKQRELKDRGAV